MNKEEVYDALINPYMGTIIDICKKHGISMIAEFAIPTEDDHGLYVATNLPDETGELAPIIADMARARNRDGSVAAALTLIRNAP